MQIKESIAISENGFVFDASTGDSFQVNNIGTAILGLIRSHKSDSEIKTELLELFDVDEIVLEKDLFDFLAVLRQHNIISTENN